MFKFLDPVIPELEVSGQYVRFQGRNSLAGKTCCNAGGMPRAEIQGERWVSPACVRAG
jgi:hypothetical protein